MNLFRENLQLLWFSLWTNWPLPRLGQGEGFFKMQAKKVILGSGRLRAGSIIAEEETRSDRSLLILLDLGTPYPQNPPKNLRISTGFAAFSLQDLVIKRGSRLQAMIRPECQAEQMPLVFFFGSCWV